MELERPKPEKLKKEKSRRRKTTTVTPKLETNLGKFYTLHQTVNEDAKDVISKPKVVSIRKFSDEDVEVLEDAFDVKSEPNGKSYRMGSSEFDCVGFHIGISIYSVVASGAQKFNSGTNETNSVEINALYSVALDLKKYAGCALAILIYV